jgi:phytanoyl-CoA hydroxylase
MSAHADVKPLSGEKMWIDDPLRFERILSETDDVFLKQCATKFASDGYVLLESVLDDSTIESAKSAYREWCAVADQGRLNVRSDGRPPRIVNLHGSRPELAQVITRSSLVLKVSDFLFGYRTSVYTSLTFMVGTEQPIHRDTPVFRTQPEEFYFGIWFALEDADEENGALIAVRGGHREGRVDPFDFAEARPELLQRQQPSGDPLWPAYQQAVYEKCMSEGKKTMMIPAKKGDAVIWHPQLPHGGGPIKDSTRSRMSIVFHVVPEGVPVYQADVFFMRERVAKRESSFRYREFEGRQFVANTASIGSN